MASVLDLVKHYQHAIEKYPNDEQKVLKSIDKLFGLSVTVQHLQDTGVGRTVNALRKEPGEVGTAARALVNKWKAMVAAEESDHDAQNNDTTNYNGNGNGKDSDHSSSKSRSRHNHSSYERTSETEVTSTSQINGNASGSKRKYYSSEEEENSIKKSKHSSSSENDEHKKKSVNVKREPSETDNDHEDSDDSHSSDSESDLSESSEDDRKGNLKIKEEPVENHKTASKHSSHNNVDHKKENSSSKKSSASDKHSKSHSSDSRNKSDKSSSRERSQNSHKHKSSNDKERSSEKKHRSDHNFIDKDNKKDSNSSSKHKTSSDKHSNSEKHKSSLEKHRSTSEKHSNSSKSSSGKDNKSDKHKDKSDKHESKSEKHLSQSQKSDKEKHKNYLEKEDDKHKSRESSSSSKEKHSSSGKEKSRSSSSKEKSSENHKSEKKSSSHESKSRSESKDKTRKSDDTSENKSNHKSSSSSSRKRSSSSKTEDVPKTKSKVNHSADSDDGIDCGSGASFAEALGMMSPVKPKKKAVSMKDMSSPNSFSTDLSPAALLAPTAKLAPLPTLEISALPEISPNYRPRPPPRLMPHFTDDEALAQSISSKNQRTKVYSGNKVIGKIPSLYELCVHVLQEHIDDLEFTGGVPYEILKPIVDKATPQQLFMLEYHNPYLTEDTDHLWKTFCEKHFRTKRRQEMEAWKEMYMRCQEEQEDKLKSLTANIRLTQEAKKAPVKQTKMAYVDSVVKPPRNIARKQAQHGTAFASTASPAARVASLASGPNVLRGGTVRPPTGGPVSSSSFKPKKAPLMAKALQFMRGRKR